MYDYVWIWMTMYDFVWLWMTMNNYVWLCITNSQTLSFVQTFITFGAFPIGKFGKEGKLVKGKNREDWENRENWEKRIFWKKGKISKIQFIWKTESESNFKNVSYFCKLLKFSNNLNFFMIQMFSNFAYFKKKLDFVYLCLSLFTFVQMTPLYTNFVLVSRWWNF